MELQLPGTTAESNRHSKLVELLDKLKTAKQQRIDSGRTNSQKQDQIAASRERCLKFSNFIEEAWPILEPTNPFIGNWHIDALGEHLEAVTAGEIPLLQVNMPPGCMKSMTVSVMFGAYEWGPRRMPGLRYLTSSYREDYANRDSRKMRDLVMSPWYRERWPHVRLTRFGDSDFENTYRGRRKATPFKSLTGDRGNRVIIDDPHSLDQAESEQTRPAAVQTFRESVPSRVNDPIRDAIILMMQRFHPEDVCGVIEELGLPYVKVIFPMEFVPSLVVNTRWYTDPRTELGELLHPARFPRDKIELKKVELGPHAWDTQYQQRPRAREGAFYFSTENFLDKDGTAPALPTLCDSVFAVIDTATKTGKKRDGTGVMFFACSMRVPDKKLWIADWDIQQIDAALLITWLPNVFIHGEKLAKDCGARSGFTGVYIEDKDSGQVLLQQAALAQLGAVHPIDSKMTALGKDGRALKISGHIYTGHVRFAQPAYDKTSIYKGKTKNHALDQATTYRIGHGTLSDDDELFDTLTYGVDLAMGEA